MDSLGTLRNAFFDELSKIGATRKNMTVAQSRKGRRPMRVQTMLRKEKEGSLFKDTKVAADLGTNSAGFKLQGKTEVQGIPVAIENRKGSVRKGENDDGSKWRTKYKVPYGYIEGTTGADGEEVDAYVGPKKDADKAFVVHQKKDDGSYDEDTVMLGFKSKRDAKKAILAHYDDPKYVGPISTVTMERLKKLVASKKKLTKISSSQGSEQARVEYSEGVPLSGTPAEPPKKKGDVPDRGKLAMIFRLLKLARRKKGDVPSLEGGPGNVKAVNRQDVQSTMIGEGDAFPATDAYSKPSEQRAG